MAVDGQRSFEGGELAEIARGAVDIRVGSGRIELGHTASDRLRVRWSIPPGRPKPRLRVSPEGGVQIRSGKARLRVDLPAGMTVRVRLRRGRITSWGATGELTLNSLTGTVACRELRAGTVRARARAVNLHFAVPPELVEVRAPRTVLALPGGPYTVHTPAAAEVTVRQAPDAAGTIVVHGKRVQVLAAAQPLKLTGEPPSGR